MYPHRLMRIICAVLALAFLLSVPAQAAIFDKPPSGFKVIVLFTGVRTRPDVVAAVHCTNLDKTKTAEVDVEFFDFIGSLKGTASFDILPGRTATFTANSDFGTTSFFAIDSAIDLIDDLNQGAIRVLSKGTGKVICSANVLDDAITPSFIHDLPPFNKAGRH